MKLKKGVSGVGEGSEVGIGVPDSDSYMVISDPRSTLASF